MSKVIDMIKRSSERFMGVGGPKNGLSKSQSDLIVNVPVPVFIEYLRSYIQGETTVNVITNIEYIISRIAKCIGMKTIFAFVSDSCNGMRDVRKHF